MIITGCIVTYNNADCIEKCIDSLLGYTKKYSINIFVSDNGSTDGTLELIRSKYPQIKILTNNSNLGFGKGHNQVLPYLNSDYHFVINPDIYIDRDVIAILVDYMEDHLEVGMITPLIKYPDGTIQYLPKLNPTIRYIGISKLPYFGYLRKEYTEENKIIDKPTEIEFCTGSFFGIRSDLFKSIGGFDERYFMYFEDADISRKLQVDHKIIFNPQTYVYHEWHRENTKKFKGIKRAISSMILYFNKWGWEL